ncbi:hypothetical protein AB0J43_14900 [Nonomuraea fuscirosea]
MKAAWKTLGEWPKSASTVRKPLTWCRRHAVQYSSPVCPRCMSPDEAKGRGRHA